MSKEKQKRFLKIAIVLVVILAASSIARLFFDTLLLSSAPEIAGQKAAIYSVFVGALLGVYLGFVLFNKDE